MKCPLCNGCGKPVFGSHFYACPGCQGFYRDHLSRLSREEEKSRYQTHNNDVNDPRYQSFVMPIVSAVMRDFTTDHSGLDFGAGTGPVISKMLQEEGLKITQYDPFFCDRPKLLEDTYDYIVCCEVIEHFCRPEMEFALLKRLLRPGGKLYCMTHLYSPEIDFSKWYYIKDPTHVFIYQSGTLQWIRDRYSFSDCIIQDRLITFKNGNE